MNILGIESSCDETAAAIVADGSHILSSIVSSQVTIHSKFGGVVPELASRKHIESIVPVVEKAFEEAGLTPSSLDGIAVTQGPGLVGALLVGFSFARAYAYALGLPWIGVNHLEGHIHALFLGNQSPSFPFVALLASGGHTSIFYITGYSNMELMGQTRDDAAGEAYDKVAKMLALGYPGGAIIDHMAKTGDPAHIPFPRAYLDKERFDFSFSGLKTAVKRHIETHSDAYHTQIPDIVAGFQESVVDVLCYKLIHAAEVKQCDTIAVVGGVAANSRLREKIAKDAGGRKLKVYMPPISLCGDNAAMIAAAGFHRLNRNCRSQWSDDVYSRSKNY